MTFNPDWSKRARFLTQALIVSGALNIGLMATFIAFALRETEESVTFEHEPATSSILSKPTNQDILSIYAGGDFKGLVTELSNKEFAEEGYKKRDLALASLVAFHGFNLEQVIGPPSQKRVLSFIHREGGEKIDVPVFPGISDAQFEAIEKYAKTERWPLTSEGLFFEIQKSAKPEPSLLETFYLTPEFTTVSSLFLRSGLPLSPELLLNLLKQTDWTMVSQFSETQKTAQDLSPEKMKEFLLSMVKKRSSMAAKILLECDRSFVLRKLDDADLMIFIDLFKEMTPSLESLLKELLVSPRGDHIWRKAAEKLYFFSGLPFPTPYDHAQALARFFPQLQQVKAALPKPHKSQKTYTIQAGDNLWKIAKKHKVTINDIRTVNNLENDKLKVGKTIVIPEPL
jgi:hypothetical protein